mmetsp:Transcript_55187/g.119205  ORF Transcript_55187/g.119205 Transcript_55187/m.119205 type:complete len:88 (+) Transcript_55187:171-434(+)
MRRREVIREIYETGFAGRSGPLPQQMASKLEVGDATLQLPGQQLFLPLRQLRLHQLQLLLPHQPQFNFLILLDLPEENGECGDSGSC